jgi:hypothetical protein
MYEELRDEGGCMRRGDEGACMRSGDLRVDA